MRLKDAAYGWTRPQGNGKKRSGKQQYSKKFRAAYCYQRAQSKTLLRKTLDSAV